MENIARPQWEPNEREHNYLLWSLRTMGNSILSMTDVYICAQLYAAFRTQFGVTDPNVPSLDVSP